MTWKAEAIAAGNLTLGGKERSPLFVWNYSVANCKQLFGYEQAAKQIATFA
uniref:hypothetical protein n=1 Tax=Agathobacter sp. TaxID=2021311 RepID=UPI0040560B26